MDNTKPTINLPFDVLPESRDWTVGKAYRVRVVLRQTGVGEEGADFEVVDATSLEPGDKGRRYYVTDSGTLKS